MRFVIDTDNNITALGSQDASSAQGETFHTQEELAQIAAKWPNGRLVQIWNTVPGLTPTKKLKDQKAAIGKLWKAIQGLDGSPAQTSTPAKTAATSARKPATKAKQAAKPTPTAKAGRKASANPATKAPKGAASARTGQREGHGPGALPVAFQQYVQQ